MGFPRLGINDTVEDFEYFEVMIWINIHVGLPLTFLVIALCFAVRMDHSPATYYVNLLVSNLIQIITLIVYVIRRRYYYHTVFIVYTCSGTASFCFRMIISLERFLFISQPQCHFMRQAKGFVTICLFVWIFSGVLIFLLIIFWDGLPHICFLFLGTLVSVIFLAVTLKSLCTAGSMPVKQKIRITGTLVLLLVNHIVIIFPTGVYLVFLRFYPFKLRASLIGKIIFTLTLHSPLMDLILFVFMSKGPFVKLLMGLCCCRKETPVVNESSSSLV